MGTDSEKTWLWPSWCCRPSPASVVRPAVAPSTNPRVARVGARPDQIGDALEAEHRIEDEKWDRVDAVRRVRRPGGDERRHRPGFGDAFLENLPVLRFLVIEKRIHVDRLVFLADVRVDADLRGKAPPCRRCALRREQSARSDRQSLCHGAASTGSARTPSSSRPCDLRCPGRTRRRADRSARGAVRRARRGTA